tara:strand:+ start:9414 stop:9770 length:357 start_codon:yes stop_codon:yes gene_type:complete
MANIYDRFQGTAKRLLAQYATGDVARLVITPVPAANEWELPTVTTESIEVDAFVTGVSEKYADGERVILSDRMAIVAGDVPISAADNVTIDGQGVEVVQIIAVPAAGTAAIKKLIVRG